VDEKKHSAKRNAATTTKARSSAKSKSEAKSRAKPRTARRASLPPPARLDPATARREHAKGTALAIAVAALDKKAERVEIVDIGEKVDYADYLVVMTGRSDRQVVAIAQGIEEALDKKKISTRGREGVAQGHWVLIDVGDVIVHIFLEEARRYYDLEGLWLDAPRVPTPAFVPSAPAASTEEG
jgi:ribosome-associated protein